MLKKDSIIAFRLNSEFKQSLMDQAEKETRSITSLIMFVLKKYLEDQKKA